VNYLGQLASAERDMADWAVESKQAVLFCKKGQKNVCQFGRDSQAKVFCFLFLKKKAFP